MPGWRISNVKLALFVVTVMVVGCQLGQRHNTTSPVMLTSLQLASTQYASGSVGKEELPWTHDVRFQQTMAQANTPILVAAFRAYLADPIGSEAENIAIAAERISGTIVPPGSTFSLNKTLGPYTAENGYLPGPNYMSGDVVMDAGGGVCKIATMLYNLTVMSNLPVEFRQPHTMIVPYVPPGQDATVSYSAGLDYLFSNNTTAPLLIWGKKVGPALYMAFYGSAAAPQVTWHHQTLSHVPMITVFRYNPNLPRGTQVEVTPGFDGYVVRSWVDVLYPNGRVEKRQLGISGYRMCPRIIERNY